MRRLSPSIAPAGYSPARYVPLSPALELDQGQRLTDIQAIQRLFANGENGGYWPADPQYLYEDSAGTIPATLNGVVGLWANNAPGKSSAIQATTANKPYLRITPASRKYWLDPNTENGALTATFDSALGSACTIVTVGPDGVLIQENQTITTTHNIAPAYAYASDILIINRALTAVEKALVTRVLSRNVPTLGSELVVNGNFENGTTGWVPNAYYPYSDFSVINGVAVVTASSDTRGAILQILLEGNIYGRQFYGKGAFKLVSGSVASFYYSNAISQSRMPAVASYAVGDNVQCYLATYSIEPVNGLAVSISASASSVTEVDNVSFKEIL